MLCYVYHWYVFVIYLTQLEYKFLILDTYHPDSKDVRIRGYISKPKGTREKEERKKKFWKHCSTQNQNSAASPHHTLYSSVIHTHN
jgi:hypothetical protein